MKINIGAGRWQKEGWLNLDCDPLNEHTNIIFDIVSNKSFPFENESVDKFYCSMLFSHLPNKYVQHALNECYRCLKDDGTFLVVVPIPIHDIRQFIRRLNMIHWRFAYNHAENNRHINFFTFGKLKRMFRNAGFTCIKKNICFRC